MKKVLIIDCNNLCYSSFYTFGNLSYQEKKTGVIFGFIQKIISLAKKFETNEFIFCWDSRKSYRKLIYPEYKANRRVDLMEQEKIDLELAFVQFAELRIKVLPAMGFNNNLMQVGYEADDLIAEAVNRNQGEYNVVISTDQDLYQLLVRALMYNHKTKKTIKKKDFVNEYSVLPDQWAEVKAIAGCSTDNVVGIEGVGEITAIKYLKGILSDGKIKSRIESDEGNKIIERNRKLVYLPFKGRKKLKINFKENNLSKEKFIDIFVNLGFESLLRKDPIENWCKIFNL